MGTSILATLLHLHAADLPGVGALAPVVLVLAWVLLLGLSASFAHRVRTVPGALRSTITNPAVAATWGTVSMGILAAGSATLTVLPDLVPRFAPFALAVDEVTWLVGTGLGLVTSIGFAIALRKGVAGEPSLIWGLPVVAPMVSATTGTALVAHQDDPTIRAALLIACAACFALALILGLIVFGIGYHYHWRTAPVPLAASASTWIPLGIVGQSTAAAQAMATQAQGVLPPDVAARVHSAAMAYGWGMLAVGIPLIACALFVTIRGFVRHMPFTPGWWALTFPIGTLALGTHLLGQASGHPLLPAASIAFTVTLVGTWTLCAVASVRAVACARTA